MCGRYAAASDPERLVEEFEATAPVEQLGADYNVAPTKPVYIVVDRQREGVRERSVEIARWGLVPSWAKDPSIGARLVNARAETVAEKPSFRSALAKRRCLLPADGYYEWHAKQPYFIHRRDGRLLALAGLYEWWRDATVPDGDPRAWRLTCTVITTAAQGELAAIHDRIPMVIGREDWRDWLDPSVASDPMLLAAPASTSALEAYPVSTAVNNVRNNGPALLERIDPEQALDRVPS